MLAGDLRPTSGSVTLDGIALDSWSYETLARRRAVLAPSDPGLAWPVREIVALGRLPHPRNPTQDTRVVGDAMLAAGLGAHGRTRVRAAVGRREGRRACSSHVVSRSSRRATTACC